METTGSVLIVHKHYTIYELSLYNVNVTSWNGIAAQKIGQSMRKLLISFYLGVLRVIVCKKYSPFPLKINHKVVLDVLYYSGLAGQEWQGWWIYIFWRLSNPNFIQVRHIPRNRVCWPLSAKILISNKPKWRIIKDSHRNNDLKSHHHPDKGYYLAKILGFINISKTFESGIVNYMLVKITESGDVLEKMVQTKF